MYKLDHLKSVVESKYFERLIIAVIIANAVTLGFETLPGLSLENLKILHNIDSVFLSIFVIELVLKMIVYRKLFFKDPWRVFDFIVVSLALLPSAGPLSVVRAFRVLRVLRLVSTLPALRRVVNGLLTAVPGLSSVAVIMLLIFYVGSVIATKLFGQAFPEWFGGLGKSSYTLFQVMTLESWSMGIVRPVMEKFPFAWMFFLPFILVATFTMLNLFIAVIVNAMQSETDKVAEVRAVEGHSERADIMKDLKEIKESIAALQKYQ